MKNSRWMWLALIAVWFGTFQNCIRVFADVLHRRECRQLNNVYQCERVVTWRPVVPALRRGVT